MINKRSVFLEILKDAYPQGYSPIYTTANVLQLWREDLSYRLDAYNEICQYQRYQGKKGYSWYETQCGNSVDLEVSPISNGFTYCPFCSGTIEYILDADTDDDFAESELSNDELDDGVTL